MRALAFIFFCFFTLNYTFSQTTNPVPKQPLWMDGHSPSGRDLRYEGFRGSPLFMNEWINGEINLADGRVFEDVPLKYNTYTKGLFMKTPAGDSIAVFSNLVSSFIIKDPVSQSEFVFKRYPLAKTPKKQEMDAYFLVLYEGKTTLLKLVSKVIKKADYKDPYSNNIRYDTYEDANEYYILKADNSLVKIKKSKKALPETFIDKEQELNEFIIQQHLEVKTDAELVRIVAKYDTF
ncbi:MAG: hypothetical protein U0X91_29435 [Spirosomataceae bacterium]